jgi:predicted enzyme related to lactoylglutathione lyase
MSTDIAHFAINADDPQASLRFYEALFGWRFEPFFFEDPGGNVAGAMQYARE